MDENGDKLTFRKIIFQGHHTAVQDDYLKFFLSLRRINTSNSVVAYEVYFLLVTITSMFHTSANLFFIIKSRINNFITLQVIWQS